MKTIKWIFLSVFLVNVILSFFNISFQKINIGAVLITVEICYIVLSLKKVNVDELAVILFWGKPIGEVKQGGLYFVPWGIVELKKEKSTWFQNELPGEPEQIFHEDGKAPEGMFTPIRIKFGQPKDSDSEELKKDPYNVAIVTEVVPVVAWRINSPINFFTRMGDIENCKKLLSDKVIEIITDDLSTMTPAKALLNLKGVNGINNKIKTELNDFVSINNPNDNWGIEIKDAYLKPFNFSHGLNDAVVGVVKAGQKAKETVLTANAERTKRSEEGAGDAEAKKLMLDATAEGEYKIKKLALEAEAIGMEALIKATGTPEGQAILWMKTLGKALENSQYTIIPGSELFTAASGIQEMLEKIKGGAKR